MSLKVTYHGPQKSPDEDGAPFIKGHGSHLETAGAVNGESRKTSLCNHNL